MFFDIIFMIQHYILYKNSNSDLKEKKKEDINQIDKLLETSNRESEAKE